MLNTVFGLIVLVLAHTPNNPNSGTVYLLFLVFISYFNGRFGVVVGILAYYASGRGFDSRTVQTFVCMNMSVCIGFGYFYV
jgi:hypothetical protein